MPRDKFHVGQRVLWKCRHGQDYTATVISQRELRDEYSNGKLTGKRSLIYRLDVDGYGTRAAEGYSYGAEERELRPLYDGDRPSSWRAVERVCGWNPEKSRVSG